MREIFGLFMIMLAVTMVVDLFDARKNREYLQSLDEEMEEWERKSK